MTQKTPTMLLKRGDTFKVDLRTRDHNNETAIDLAEQLVEANAALEAARIADPYLSQDEIDAQLTVDNLEASYEVAVNIDISSWTITSQVRYGKKLIEELTVTIDDGLNGYFSISATALQTEKWTCKELQCDIEFVRPGIGTVSSETFLLDVQKDVTYDD